MLLEMIAESVVSNLQFLDSLLNLLNFDLAKALDLEQRLPSRGVYRLGQCQSLMPLHALEV